MKNDVFSFFKILKFECISQYYSINFFMGSDESSIQQSSEKSTLPLISGQILISVHGSSGSGKTTLINQLVKKEFNSEYFPTKQMESRQILWNSKIKPNETIRIIVWDVVEKTTTSPRPVDTFSRADGIVLVYNPDDPYSVEYALSILYKLPINGTSEKSDIPVLILSNFLDVRGNRLKIHPRLSNFPYPHIQSSLKTGIGLEVCEKWIDRALLYNKQRSLNARLQSVRKEREELLNAICSTIEENENILYMQRKPNPIKKPKETSKRTPIPYVIRKQPSMPPLSELLTQKEDSEPNNKSDELNNEESKKEEINKNNKDANDSAQFENENCKSDNENNDHNITSNDDSMNNAKDDNNIINNTNDNNEDNKDSAIKIDNKNDSINECNNDDDNKNAEEVENNTKDNS